MSQIGARHLLIKFSGSRNPVSRRTNASTAGVTAEAAQAELQSYADKINAEGATEEVRARRAIFGAQLSARIHRCANSARNSVPTLPPPVQVFAKYATERSDCGSFKQGGDLGTFGPGEMQSQFEEGTRATEVRARAAQYSARTFRRAILCRRRHRPRRSAR